MAKISGKCLRTALLLALLLVSVSSVRAEEDDHDEEEEDAEPAAKETKEGLGHGFGENFEWVPFAQAYSTAKAVNKPILLIIHKSWCGACKTVGPRFAESEEVQELSKNFVMVNTVDDEEPPEEMYKPDGGYIPRFLFLDADQNLLDIKNDQGHPQYQYFYNDAEQIVDAMERATKLYSSGKDEL